MLTPASHSHAATTIHATHTDDRQAWRKLGEMQRQIEEISESMEEIGALLDSAVMRVSALRQRAQQPADPEQRYDQRACG